MKQSTENGEEAKGSTTMWIGVAVVFGLMVCAWIAMFFLASKHRPDTVPLENPGETR
jgi:hypothetical protein